jgi:hypothetical protein
MAGGGAGTAGAAYTGNDDIVLPAESALSFKLRSSLTVNPTQWPYGFLSRYRHQL